MTLFGGESGPIAKLLTQIAVDAVLKCEELRIAIQRANLSSTPSTGARDGTPKTPNAAAASGIRKRIRESPEENGPAEGETDERHLEEALSSVVGQLEAFDLGKSIREDPLRTDDDKALDKAVVAAVQKWEYSKDYQVLFDSSGASVVPVIRCKCLKTIRLQFSYPSQKTSAAKTNSPAAAKASNAVNMTSLRFHIFGRHGKNGYPRSCHWAKSLGTEKKTSSASTRNLRQPRRLNLSDSDPGDRPDQESNTDETIKFSAVGKEKDAA